MKLRAPDGCASICHEGQIFIVEADGSIEVKTAMVAVLSAHGFLPWDGGENAPTQAAATDDADIESFNRPRLFAFLRAKGVRVRLPITNGELRAAARKVKKAETSNR